MRLLSTSREMVDCDLPSAFGYFGYVAPASKHKLNAVPFVITHMFHGASPFVLFRHHPSAPAK